VILPRASAIGIPTGPSGVVKPKRKPTLPLVSFAFLFDLTTKFVKERDFSTENLTAAKVRNGAVGGYLTLVIGIIR
jgi:hypothetical protein